MELRNVCSVLFLFLCCLSLINAQGPSPRNSPSNCDPNDPFLCPNRTIPDPSPTPFPKPDSPGPCIPDPFFPNGSVVVTLYKGNVLGWFQAGRAESVHLILVRGITGLLKAIDVRYSDGKLYGYADCNRIYTIDLVYGNASFVSQLNVPFNGSYSVGFEFVPNNDGFVRLVGNGGKNYLVELSTGNVAARTDRNLHYIKGDPQLRFGTQVLDAGYSFTEVAGSTAFYVINAAGNGSLAVIDPAGGSILSTVGILDAVPLGRRIGFDVAQYTDDSGNTAEIALMVSVNRYWTVDLSDGSTERIWRRSLLRKIPYNAWGLAIVAPQFVSTVLGELTANYISELYETAKVGNCTPCGSCPWDDRVVVLGDDSGSGSGGRRLTERAVEQVVNPGGYNGEDNNGGHHDEAVYNSAENEVIEDEGGNDSN